MTATRLRLRDRRPRAFTTIEMLGVLMLLTAFALVATRLFATTIKLTFNAAQAHDNVASADTAEAALRADIAGAKRIETTDTKTATLTTADDRVITWSIQDGRLLRRVNDDEEHWRAPAGETTFTTDGVSLVLKIENRKLNPPLVEIWMTSPAKMVAKLME